VAPVRIWVDCTASAHPLVLRPLIDRFERAGHEVKVTARDLGQTEGNLARLGIPYTSVGGHGGASMPGKALALAARSLRLARWARRWRPGLAVGHGSVDLAVVSALLRIPSAQLQDYEFAGLQRRISFRVARRVLVPDSIPVERLEQIGVGGDKLVRYPGLKEDYYLADLEPDPAVLGELGLDRERVIVVVRPPPDTAEYHAENPLHERVIDRLAGEPGVQTVVLPRSARQASSLARRTTSSEQLQPGRLIVPGDAVDAQSLIAQADLVVSAGGTMNREAVALGTPVWTTFAGRMGGVDEALIAAGRLRILRDPADLELVKRREPVGVREPRDPELLVRGVLGAVE
jgi:uncharacterized protein